MENISHRKSQTEKQNVAICNLYFCHERSKDANN